MSQKFDVLFSVSSNMLSTLLEAAEGRANLLQVQLSQGNARIGYMAGEGNALEYLRAQARPATLPAPAINKKTKLPQSSRFANGVRNKGISGSDLIIKTLSTEVQGQMRPWTYNEIAQEFVNHGFARTTTSSTLWQMTRAKKVRFLGDGKYCLPGATISN